MTFFMKLLLATLLATLTATCVCSQDYLSDNSTVDDLAKLESNEFVEETVLRKTKQNQKSSGEVSAEEFRNAVTEAGYPAPRPDHLANFNTIIRSFSISKIHAAMILANSLLETTGLIELRENVCKQQNCATLYYCTTQSADCTGNNCGAPPGVAYNGRGYLQLTWCYNYKPAAAYLGADIFNNPDLVANDELLAWRTAGWFWNTRVLGDYRPKLVTEVRNGQFGSSIAVINGGMECPPTNNIFRAARHKRITNYEAVFKAFKIPGEPNYAGCAE